MRAAALLLLVATAAHAEPWQLGVGGLTVGAGYEIESLGELTHASVTKVSGLRIAGRFDGVTLQPRSPGEPPVLSFSFARSFVSLDLDPSLSAIGLNRAADATTLSETFRKVVVAPVQVEYRPWRGPVFFRGRFGTFDYDREKGFWDWRAAELQAVVSRSFALGDSARLVAELGLGASAGGIEIANLGALERALQLTRRSDEAVTIEPVTTGLLALRGGSWSVGLAGAVAQRFDATGNRPLYQGRRIDAQSTHGRFDLIGEFLLAADGKGRTLCGVLETGVEFDNLTVIRMLFGSSDAFIAFQSLLGARVTF
jgi:hypothetical protein